MMSLTAQRKVSCCVWARLKSFLMLLMAMT